MRLSETPHRNPLEMDNHKQTDCEIFHQALNLDSLEAQLEFIASYSSRNASQYARLKLLIEQHHQQSSFLEAPLPKLIETNRKGNEAFEKEGFRIGPYILREQIGEGGMGVVFIAEQLAPVRRKVALKIVKPGHNTLDVIARFEAERQALALMDHSNIAKVFDAGSTPTGRPYFVMELVRGSPVTTYCDTYKLNTPQRLALFVKICHAVQHAHMKGIIHRDIKPGNLLVTRNGDQSIPKVIDFGVAKAIDQPLTEKTIYTRNLQLIGTPLYMSPEQAELSESDADTRTDIYSLGVVLYELLTGTTPFLKVDLQSAGFDEMRRIIREVDPPRPSDRISTFSEEDLSTVNSSRRYDGTQIRNRLRGELDWIVMKALEKDRSRRYATANEFAADVLRYLDDQPVEAGPPSRIYRVRKLIRRNRFSICTATMVAAVLILGIATTSWQAIQATWERDKKQEALTDLSVALADKELALAAATAESLRASQNLKLAMRAIDRVYLKPIDEGSAYRRQMDWIVMPGDSTSLLKHGSEASRPPLSDGELKLLSEGLTLYDQLASKNPDSESARFESAQALMRVARIQISLERTAEAELAFDRGIQMLKQLTSKFPDNDQYSLALGEAQYHLGQINRWKSAPENAFEIAIKCADRCIATVARSEQSYRLRAKANIALSRYKLAESDLLHLISITPDCADYHADLGRLYQHMNDYPKSIVYAQNAVQMSPENVERNGYREILADAYSQSNLPDREAAAQVWESGVPFARALSDQIRMKLEAAKLRHDYRRIVELAEDWEKARGRDYDQYLFSAFGHGTLGNRREALADLATVTRRASKDPVIVWPLIEAGLIYHEILNDNELAANAFRAAWSRNPNSNFACYCLGSVVDRQQKHREAIRIFSQGIEIAPAFVPLYHSRAYSRIKIGNYNAAISDLRKAVELDPDNPFLFSLAVQDEVASCRDPEFVSDIQGILEKVLDRKSMDIVATPEDASLWNSRVYANVLLEQYENAIRDASQAIKLDPLNPDYWDSRAFAYSESEQWKLSIKDLTKAIELEPKNCIRWAKRGGLYLELWEYAKAVSDYSRAIELMPGDAALISDRGFCHLQNENFDLAIKDFNEALRLEPASIADFSHRGMAYVEQEQYDKAINDFGRAVELDPSDTFSLYHLGFAYFQLGDDEKAFEALNRSIEIEPTTPILWIAHASASLRTGKYGDAIQSVLVACGMSISPDITLQLLESEFSKTLQSIVIEFFLPGSKPLFRFF